MSVIKLAFDDIVSVHLLCDGLAHETIRRNDKYVSYTYETVDLTLEVVRKISDKESENESRNLGKNH